MSINNLKYILVQFGYNELNLIRPAMNSLLRVLTQLVRSDGFDEYTTNIFLNAGNQNLYLTPIGKGYIKNLIYSLDYIQEVMLDCYLPKTRFGAMISNKYLNQKLDLVYSFLLELLETDIRETNNFKTELDLQLYYKNFGERLISYEIIQKVYPQVKNLIYSIINDDKVSEEIKYFYRDTLRKFESLIIFSKEKNFETLGIYHTW